MNKKHILLTLGKFLTGYSVFLMLPALLELLEKRPGYGDCAKAFFLSALICFAFGLLARWFGRGGNKEGLRQREAFVLVTLSWLVLAFFGALPFWLTPKVLPSFTDAFFESMSGLTTTGASVITDVEAMPRGILLWRSLSHFLGGMGIIVLAVAVTSSYGNVGYFMMKAEVPGASPDRLTPRIAETAKTLWKIYVFLALAECLLLMMAGMDWFDSINHSMATVATGGFSTKNASIGHFANPAIHWIVIVFMTIAGMNFTLHFLFLKGNFKAYRTNSEWLFYVWLVVALSLCIAGLLLLHGDYKDPLKALQDSAFSVTTLLTCTGFATADYDQWPNILRLLLMGCMFCGACLGSTGGGIKCFRVLAGSKMILNRMRNMARPRVVFPLKLDGRALHDQERESILTYIVTFVAFFAVATVLLSIMLPSGPGSENSIVTAASSVVSCMSNVGPGLAFTGPMCNYSAVPDAGKALLCFCMLAGRLEIYTLLLFFSRRVWTV